MRNHRLVLFALLIVGCSQQQTIVFVDLDKVALSQTRPKPVEDLKPDSAELSIPNSKSIPGDAGKTVENLKADEKAKIRQEVEKETDEAIETISKRLHDYYSREIDDFYKIEFAKFAPLKQSLTAKYLADVREIFEESARQRGPLLTRLVFMTEFPPPKELITLDEKGMSSYESKKRAQILAIQKSIAQIDLEYKLATDKLKSTLGSKIDQETNRILAEIQAKQTEIDQRAKEEASRLVKRFSSGLAKRIFSRYTFQLEEIPTKTVNFPKMAAQSGIPRVTFDRNQLSRNERAGLLKELEAFLSLNHYQRTLEVEGGKDATKEFIEWRTNLKSGHWEGSQKSSTPN